MRLRIVSNGTQQGTRVVNADTGEPVAGVSAVEWRMGPFPGATPLARAVITVEGVSVELEGLADTEDQRRALNLQTVLEDVKRFPRRQPE